MRTTRWIGSVLAVTIGGMTLTGTVSAPTADAHSPARENRAAAAAVTLLTADDHALAASAIPDDFAAVMGYRPTVIDGTVVNPLGACSSPIPLPAEFDTACKAHDLGYDLLRYAHRGGGDLGAWARTELDAQLDRRMHAACDARAADRTSCFAMANTATAAVGMNSMRQGFGAPVDEPWIRYGLGGLLGTLGALLVTLTLRRIRPMLGLVAPSPAVAA
ncbi:hypothetical protein [Rhodococcus sp. BE178]|uniref:hypothetical protein n=1 Tax=Rhodococcus sp. BE178 TaxID=2817737 RepID=UPI003D1F1B08